MAIKFGILGCADIARKVSRAITLSPNSVLHAVGSRTLEKATEFARKNGFPDSAKVYGSYDAVLDDPEVDAVYMPLPTSLHAKWAVLAARKGKHVLLEKPVALDVSELDAILEACESAGVQFMDATMWMHHPRTAKMKDFLLDPALFGQLKYGNIRCNSADYSGEAYRLFCQFQGRYIRKRQDELSCLELFGIPLLIAADLIGDVF